MVGQHFVSTPLQMFQAMPLLARLAAEAEGMQISPGLLLLPLLNPVIVAEECATSTGSPAARRSWPGLGYRKEEFELNRRAVQGTGAALRRGRRTDQEAVARRCRRASGRFHTVTGVTASLKPQQEGGPPIWMAGDVEVAVKRAAKIGDAWMPSPMVSEESV